MASLLKPLYFKDFCNSKNNYCGVGLSNIIFVETVHRPLDEHGFSICLWGIV